VWIMHTNLCGLAGLPDSEQFGQRRA
jgi:hypothetical protein